MGKAASRAKTKNLLTISLSEEDLQTLDESAKMRCTTKSALVRIQIRLFKVLLDAERNNVVIYLKHPSGELAQLLVPG